MELVRSVCSEVYVLKKPGGGKNIHSVFEGVLYVPMFILSPNEAKRSERRVINISMLVSDSKTNTQSST